MPNSRYLYRVETIPIASLESGIRTVTETGYAGDLTRVGGWRLVFCLLNGLLPIANAICIFEREYSEDLGSIAGTGYDDS